MNVEESKQFMEIKTVIESLTLIILLTLLKMISGVFKWILGLPKPNDPDQEGAKMDYGCLCLKCIVG